MSLEIHSTFGKVWISLRLESRALRPLDAMCQSLLHDSQITRGRKLSKIAQDGISRGGGGGMPDAWTPS